MTRYAISLHMQTQRQKCNIIYIFYNIVIGIILIPKIKLVRSETLYLIAIRVSNNMYIIILYCVSYFVCISTSNSRIKLNKPRYPRDFGVRNKNRLVRVS